MSPTVVVLAAGMGSRFGGIKQLEGVGPGGETLMDYSLYDALRSGFTRVVFVIRRDIEEAFRERVGRAYEQRTNVAYAFQELSDLTGGITPPPERTKPWGTGHAVLAAAPLVQDPFCVINADDFYGRSAMTALAAFLRGPCDARTCALVGYTLRATLSEHGAVSRGLCTVDSGGLLRGIRELTKIERHGREARYPGPDGRWIELSGDETVSMNLWGFPVSMFEMLDSHFKAFLATSAGSTSAEFYAPTAVNELMTEGRVSVRVLRGGDDWCGVTYREDKPHAQAVIAGLIERGVYPRVLWP